MAKKSILLFIFILTLFSACSRKVYVYFPNEDPDVVSTPNFNPKFKTVSIKSTNQTIVYTSDELSSRLNILINMMEREFKLKGIKVVKDSDNPDLQIEFIGLEPYELHTNETQKPNGKEKIIPCDYKASGAKVYVKVIDREANSIDFTFYYVPCKNGCLIEDYGYFCDGKVKKGKASNQTAQGYKVSLDQFPTEITGRRIANSIYTQLDSLSKMK